MNERNTFVNEVIKLIKEADDDTRQRIAKLVDTPVEVLSELANDEVRGVREAVKRHPSTPINIYELIVKDEIDGD